MPGPHDKIIADAAKAALSPLNFRRRGRSRTWLSDLGWQLLVVEFQPSSWSRGSYLNVAVHWLWSDLGHLSFDYGGRIAEHVQYHSDEQFVPQARRLAELAAQEAARLGQMFCSLEATVEVLLDEVRVLSRQSPGHPGWEAYNAGVAAGLVGRRHDAEEMLASILDSPALSKSRLHLAAKRMAPLIIDPIKLKLETFGLIDRQRVSLRLPIWEARSFSDVH